MKELIHYAIFLRAEIFITRINLGEYELHLP